MFPSFTAALALVTAVLANGRTTPPQGALIVGPGHYGTIQAAVNALTSTTAEQSIFVQAGTYHEQLTINKLNGPLAIYGYTTDASSYQANQVTIVAGHSQKENLHNDQTATLRASSPNFKLYNVNVVNSFGKGSQALALSAAETNQGYYGCSFKGFQDTILAQSGKQLYVNSYLEGATDFVFGQYATAWFEGCTIGVLPTVVGHITASGRDSEQNPNFYVFNRAKIGAAPNQQVKVASYYLGRPWRSYARVVFQRSEMSNVINPKGWSTWSKSRSNWHTEHVTFAEYQNFGPGAAGQRSNFTQMFTTPMTMSDILGSNFKSEYYFDASYVH
ncbi:hypothetical protein E4U21_002341 [Claviceps maximensis]|nr:hypothetical protein E4U21_002341 [Claviceps maximensis]